MKKNIKLIILCIMLLSFIGSNVLAQDVYVSTKGDDANSGSQAAPFKTISRAVKELEGSASGKTVWIAGGTYQIESAINLTSAHSGITIRNIDGEKVILTGGTAIPGHLFEQVSDEAELAKIPSIAQGKVMSANLSPELTGLFPPKSAYNKVASVGWNGYILNVAQFPNKGYAYFSNTLDEGPTTRWLAPGEEPEPYSEDNPTGGRFQMREDIDWNMMKTEFDRTKDMLLEGYLSNDWYFQQERVGAISTSEKSIKLLRYTAYGIGGPISLARRFRVTNALCQLDQPGEWYYDRTNNKFYIWPVQPPNSQTPITILSGGNVLYGENANNVIIRGITFQNFGDIGVFLNQTSNSLIAGCTFRSSRGLGARINGALNSGIQSCDFYNLDQGFVIGGSSDNRKTLTPEGNFARNNHIHHCTKRGYGMLGMSGVGAHFANNLIHDVNGALSHKGNDITIEKNEFYNVGYEMGDWNPIYCNSDFSERGNYIKYNFFHHMIETPTSHPLSPARTDDNGAGLHVNNNIMFKAGRAGCQFHGPDNSFTGNMVMEMSVLWWTNQSPYEAYPRETWKEQTEWLQLKYDEYLQLQQDILDGKVDFNIKENKVGKAEKVFGIEGWLNNSTWRAHYPNIENTFDFRNAEGSPWTNSQGDYTKNYYNGSNSLPFHFHGNNPVNTFEDIKWMMPNSSPIEMPYDFDVDTVFQDASSLDFSFLPDFDAVDGFEKWDFSDVGLYVDEYRVSIQDKNEYRIAIKEKYKDIPYSGGSLDLDELNERYSDPAYLSLVLEASLLKEAPVAYYPLNEESGTTAKDKVGTHDAEWQNADPGTLTWDPALILNGAQIPGAPDLFFQTASDPISGDTAITLSVWVNQSEVNADNGVITTGTGANTWGLSIQNNAVVASFNGTTLNSGNVLEQDKWQHIASTWRNDGTTILYVDGIEVASGTSGPAGYLSTGAWNIGALADDSGVLTAHLDEISMFNTALDSVEVALIFLSGINEIPVQNLVPIEVQGVELTPEFLKVRKRFSGVLSTLTTPSNAADQSVIWTSSDENIVSVDNKGFMEALSPGTIEIVVATNDGGFKDTAKVTVVESGEIVIVEPVAYWPMDEYDGKEALDVIGGLKANWMASEAPIWSEGRFGNAPNFNGDEEDRFIVNGDALTGTKQLTLSAWFKLNSIGNYKGLVTTRANNWGFSAEKNHIDARWNGKAIDSDNILSTNQWFNIVQSWDTSGTSNLYINGQLAKSEVLDVKEYITNNRWFFGDDICCGGREINGMLDDIAMFDTMLTDSDVKLIYNLGKFGSSIKDMIATYTESISVSPEIINLPVGKKDTAKATVLPIDATDKSVIWSSGNSSIATVDHMGVITGISDGTVDVIGTTTDGGFKDTVKTTVYTIHPSRIIVTPATLELKEGEMFNMDAEIIPDTATILTYTWSSESDAIATVSKFGLVTGIKEGNTNIVATTTDGGLVAKCAVEVIYVHVDSVVVSPGEIELEIGDTLTLSATFYPSDAQDKSMTWLSNDPSVASVSIAGLVEGLKDGITEVQAYSLDEGKAGECIVKVGNYTGLNQIENKVSIQTYPSPVRDILNLEMNIDANQLQKIEIYNAQGTLVYIEEENLFNTTEISLLGWKSGLYVISITTKDNMEYLTKFVKM